MSLFVPPVVRATDANMNALSGALWYFFIAGSTTPANVYANSDLTVPHSNPVVADSGGLFAPIYLDPELNYRAILKTSGGSTIQDIDQIAGTGFAQATQNALLGTDRGTIQTGSTNDLEIARSFKGASDGTTQFYGHVERVYAQGTQSIDYARNEYLGTHYDATAGTLNNLEGTHQYIWHGGFGGTVANAKVHATHVRVDGGSITNEVDYYRCVSATYGASASVARVVGFSIGDIGHATKVTDAFGIDIGDFSGATSAIGMRSSLNSGTGKFFIAGLGTAPSVHRGKMRVGGTTSPTDVFEVEGGNIHLVNSGSSIKINSVQVLAGRLTGCPAAATDLASAITLVNYLRTSLLSHGMIS